MKIYTDEEMELISNVFDLIALKFNSKEFSDLVREIKELFKENQKYAREIERLNNIINELANEINIAIKELQPNELVNGINLLKNIKFTLQELKGDGSNE